MFILLALGAAACQREPAEPRASATTPAQGRASDDRMSVSTWALPAAPGAWQPDLSSSPDGALLLSWVEKDPAGDALKFSRYAAGKWTTPVTIARGEWFGNSSDTPHLRATEDGALWAQWLRKSTTAGHARDVVLTRSTDDGVTWSRPVLVNLDGTPTEHGFVSLWPATRDRLGIAWLDGRNRTAEGHAHHGSQVGRMAMHGEGMTMLRSAVFDAALKRSAEAAVDTSACDCCQTDVAATPKGPLVVYRDRTAEEVRDIAVTRMQEGQWTPPRIVHADGWVMPACPINGPAVASDRENVAVGWYTSPGDRASIRLAVSADSGDRFSDPLEIDQGATILGHVDMALTPEAIWLTWLREEQSGQSLWLARIAPDGARVEQRQRIAALASRARGTGVPRTISAGGRLYLVWTDVIEGVPKLDGAMIAAR